MSLEFKKISGSTPYLLNSASTAEELTLALEDYMRTGAQIIFTHDGEDCLLSSFEYKTGIESTVIAYFVTPKKKLLKVDTAAGFDLVVTESDITPDIDITWGNLQDKPFGEITENLGDTITWDGNIDEGNDVVTNTGSIGTGTIRYIKVASSVPTIDDIGSNPILKLIGDDGNEHAAEKIDIFDEDNGIIRISYLFSFVVIVPTDNIEWADVLFPEKGVYFMQAFTADGSVTTRCTSLTIPNYNFVNTTLKKIDEKYLPDTILIKSDSAEIWAVFTEGDEIVRSNYADQATAMGSALNVELVDTLPETLTPTFLSGGDMNFYVIKSTGVPYINADGLEVVSFGYLMAEDESFNRGWTTDINAETETGVYCVRTDKIVPTKEYVDNSIANAIGNAIGGSY
jgi:hypothetical protein